MLTSETKSSTTTQSLQAKGEDTHAPFFDKEGGNSVLTKDAGESHFFDNNSSNSNKKTPFFSRPLVQTKLTIGQPGDKYEKEADSMADQVVQRLATTNESEINLPSTTQPGIQHTSSIEGGTESEVHGKPLSNHTSSKLPIQKKCAECEQEEKIQAKTETLHRKPIFESDVEQDIQTKRINERPLATQISPLIQLQEEEDELQNKPLQLLEEEEEVQTQPLQLQEEEEELQTKPLQMMEEEEDLQTHPLQLQEEEEELQTKPLQMMEEEEDLQTQPLQLQEEEEELQTKPLQLLEEKEEVQTQPLQLQEEEDELQTKPLQLLEEEEEVQTKASDPEISAGNSVESRLSQTKGNGSPLDPATQTGMESSFGADFGGVRIHTDTSAVSMSKELGAQAFTRGKDIYFNTGKYDPSSQKGKHLLAHELTHTVQQGASLPMQPTVQQQAEEGVDLEKELAASDRAAIDAFDPIPAEQTREKAEKDKQDAELAAEAQLAEKEAPSEEAPAEAPAPQIEPKKRIPDKVTPSVPEEIPKGAVGQDLDQASADVCDDAAAKTQELADNERTHFEAGEKTEQIEVAVEEPEEEGEAMSNASQVEAVEEAEEPKTDKGDMDRALSQAIEQSVPSSIEQMNAFKSEGKAKVVGNKVLAESSKQVGEIKGTYSDVENAPPAPAPAPSEPLPQKEIAPETPELNLGEGAVPKLQDEHTDFSEFEEQSDSLLEKEGISEEQLEMVDSGELAEAKEDRKELKEKVETQPDEIGAFAEGKQKEVEEEMIKEEADAKSGMEEKREEDLGDTQKKQEEAKSEMELKREKVTQNINEIYERAKTNVTAKLEQLEESSLKRFDQGQAEASNLFEQEVNHDINAWKRERYSGIFGGARWIRDKILGIDDLPEVQNAFKRARNRYIDRIDTLTLTINEENERTIQDCKDELAQAKAEIKEYVESLGPELRDVGEKAKNEMEEKLAEMHNFIEKKKQELQQQLCDKKEAAIEAIDKKIEEMKESMSGALSKLGNLLLNALIKFMEWGLNKVGGAGDQVMGIINKGKDVIKTIAGDPIEFFKNVGRSVGGGIQLFVNNIKQHLIKGLMGWLTGALGDAGLTLPDKFDLKGILSIVIQVANLTWSAIRTRMVKFVGEKKVAAAEKGIDIFKRVIVEGPIALWNIVKEKAVSLKNQVLEGIRNWAITEIVKKAAFKLVSMLNPAGAILQAIKALYDVVMFFINSWDRITSFVQSVFSSIGEIAIGQVGKASAFIEKTLVQTIPIILKFLAQFLGLSGIGKTISNIIAKIRRPIDQLIDRIVAFLVRQVKRLFGRGKKADKEATTDPQKAQKIRKGLADIEKEEKKYLNAGKISHEDAKEVTKTVKQANPVFKSINVVDGGDKWDYEYEASPKKKKKGKEKEESEKREVIEEPDNIEPVTTVDNLPRWVHNPELSKEDNLRINIGNMRELGRTAHKEVQERWLTEGFREEYLSPASRPDGVKLEGQQISIRELKPDTQNGKRKGKTQLNRYVKDVKESEKKKHKDIIKIIRRLSLWRPHKPLDSNEKKVIDSIT